MDLNRSVALWNQVYEAPKSLARRKGWNDQPSIGIPYLYLSTGTTLGMALQARGDRAGAEKVLKDTEALAKGVKLGDVFAQLRPQIEAPFGPTDSPARTAIPLGNP